MAALPAACLLLGLAAVGGTTANQAFARGYWNNG